MKTSPYVDAPHGRLFAPVLLLLIRLSATQESRRRASKFPNIPIQICGLAFAVTIA
jgi:hypothetical protein